MSIIFVSNTDINNPRGGWDGLGSKIFECLQLAGNDLVLLDRINPKVKLDDKVLSKALRLLGLKSDFPAFSGARLKNICKLFSEKYQEKEGHLFFHGATPWIGIKPSLPYSVILDCSFDTYINIYHDASQFSDRNLARIKNAERFFLSNAQNVFFTSAWALKETCKSYSLAGDNFKNIRQGPSIQLPAYSKASILHQFLFIATDFVAKGGNEVCTAFGQFLQNHPSYKLIVVGQPPPAYVLKMKQVEYIGFIDKNTPEGLAQLSSLYATSAALLLMTKKDIAPLVIIEAGLMGCPAIANAISAIPEMIVHEETGFLVNDIESLLKAMNKIAAMDQNERERLSDSVVQFMLKNYTWDGTGALISQMITG